MKFIIIYYHQNLYSDYQTIYIKNLEIINHSTTLKPDEFIRTPQNIIQW